jgi:hypothetical protein
MSAAAWSLCNDGMAVITAGAAEGECDKSRVVATARRVIAANAETIERFMKYLRFGSRSWRVSIVQGLQERDDVDFRFARSLPTCRRDVGRRADR